MTVYTPQRRGRRRPRPTLRLRLTLLNGILLIGAGAVLVLLSWTVVRAALQPSGELQPGTTVVLVRRSPSPCGTSSPPDPGRGCPDGVESLGRWTKPFTHE